MNHISKNGISLCITCSTFFYTSRKIIFFYPKLLEGFWLDYLYLLMLYIISFTQRNSCEINRIEIGSSKRSLQSLANLWNLIAKVANLGIIVKDITRNGWLVLCIPLTLCLVQTNKFSVISTWLNYSGILGYTILIIRSVNNNSLTCVISFEDVSIIALQYMHIVISFLSRDGLQKSEEQYQHTI